MLSTSLGSTVEPTKKWSRHVVTSRCQQAAHDNAEVKLFVLDVVLQHGMPVHLLIWKRDGAVSGRSRLWTLPCTPRTHPTQMLVPVSCSDSLCMWFVAPSVLAS
jgi:hypothetical protein